MLETDFQGGIKLKKSTSLLAFVSVSILLIVAVFIGLNWQDNALTDEEKVMRIAVAYIEENYGTDYVINGEVSNHSLTETRQEEDIVYNYPTASFRIPSDYYESGMMVDIMVDPSTEEMVKVIPSPSKAFPPYAIDVSNLEMEIHKSESISTNITLSLLYSEEEKTVTFFGGVRGFPKQSRWFKLFFPFEAIFEPEQLVLKHQETKSVILTLTADSDAPLGLYTLTISAKDGNKGIGATLRITVVE